MRLTDILLEPVSNLMVLMKAEGAKLDAATRRIEAKGLLLMTRRLPTTGLSAGQVHGTLIEVLRGSIGFEANATGTANRRMVRPTEAFSELTHPGSALAYPG